MIFTPKRIFTSNRKKSCGCVFQSKAFNWTCKFDLHTIFSLFLSQYEIQSYNHVGLLTNEIITLIPLYADYYRE